MHSAADLKKILQQAEEQKKLDAEKSRPQDVIKFLDALDVIIVNAAQKNVRYVSVNVGDELFRLFWQFGQIDKATIKTKMTELGYSLSFFRSSFTVSW